jgi:Ca2+-binding RTX toxin-like protein
MSTQGIIVDGDGVNNILTGTAGDDAFAGTSIAEYFYTGLGNDDVFAGAGNDVIQADKGNDVIDGGEGIDLLTFFSVNTTGVFQSSRFGLTLDLNKTTQDLGYFGIKTIYDIEDVIATGNDDRMIGDGVANRLLGNGGNDRLDGRGGDDNVDGGTGDDVLTGGDGNDVVRGWYGVDRLYGNAGSDVLLGALGQNTDDDGFADMFIYTTQADSGLSVATQDVIWGTFDGDNADRIDLKALDANGSASGNGAFAFVGDDGFHSNSTGEVQVRATANADEYLVKIDMDTDSGSEMTMLVHSTTLLTASDFVL